MIRNRIGRMKSGLRVTLHLLSACLRCAADSGAENEARSGFLLYL